MVDDDDELEAERLGMQKLRVLRGIGLIIISKYILWAVLAAVVIFATVLTAIAHKVKVSKDRFESTSALIFCPKQNTKIRTMDGQEVMRVLSRYGVLRKLADALQLPPDEVGRLGMDLSIQQELRQKNLFTLTAHAPTRDGAVKKINTYADLCIKEYVSYRMSDLETWMETILVRKKEIQDQISKLEAKESELNHKYGVSNPEGEADRIARVIGDRRQALVEARLQLASVQLKCKKYTKELGNVSSNAMEHADSVRAYLDRQFKNEDELNNLRHMYGEENPRFKIALEKRDANIREFKEFLIKTGIKDTSGLSFTKYVGLQEKLRDEEARAELLQQSVDALDRERESLEMKQQALLGILPEFERNSRQRENLRHTLDGLEDTLSDIRYLESTCGADLSQIEPAQNASGKAPFGGKSIAVSLFATAVLVGGTMFLLIVFEFRYGRIRGVNEVAVHPDVRVLGTLPSNDDFRDENEARKVCGGIFYLYHRECKKGLVFVGMLSGSQWSRQLESSFDWNFGMSGEKSITLQLVNAIGFVEPEDAEYVGLVVKSGREAWMPVTDSAALSPGEMEMLESSVKLLFEEYDTVFLKRRDPVRKGEIFLTQILGICDHAMLFVGAKLSRRRDLQVVLDTPRRNPKSEILAVVTSVPVEIDEKQDEE